MSITNDLPTGSHFISLSTAIEMTSDYRDNRESMLVINMRGQDILPLSETFNRDDIDTILAKEGCEGIRIYYGLDGNSKLHAIMVAVNADNEDMLSSLSSTVTEPEDIIEQGQRCPDVCPPESPLNS